VHTVADKGDAFVENLPALGPVAPRVRFLLKRAQRVSEGILDAPDSSPPRRDIRRDIRVPGYPG
jgi:hypothetical protein